MLKTPPTIVDMHHLQIEAPPACEEAARTFSGADHLIIVTQMDFATETMRLTVGQGVHVVNDSLGRTTFDNSLKVLRARGSLIVFGLSSGPVPLFDMNQLSGITSSGNNGSLYLTFATLNDYAYRRQNLLRLARDVLNWIAE